MILHVTNAQYISDYRVRLEFNDGSSGVVNFELLLYGEMFEPLKDLRLFSQLKLDPELETIVWPNGADLAPEFLKDHLH